MLINYLYIKMKKIKLNINMCIFLLCQIGDSHVFPPSFSPINHVNNFKQRHKRKRVKYFCSNYNFIRLFFYKL